MGDSKKKYRLTSPFGGRTPEKFQLGSFPFSYLGRKLTPSGIQNIYSRIVFDTGMFLCAYTMYLLFYASLWLLKLPHHALFQKPAFAAIIYVELHASSLSRFQGERKVSLSLHSQQLP
jgi:hypothetical protein